MKLAVSGGKLGVVVCDAFHLVEAPLRQALEAGRDLVELARMAPAGPSRALPERLDPPNARPSHLICIGLNYRDHCRETGMSEPSSPVEFTKHPSALVGSGAPIPDDPELREEVDLWSSRS